MPSKLYESIIEKKKKRCSITNDKLKDAAQSITSSYSKSSLKQGSTYLDFDFPEIRCAYMYKYSSLHAGIVTKYFRKLIRKKEVRNNFNRHIKICSIAGGSGSDIVGIFKAMAVMPCFQRRIKKVSVLDKCSGWQNCFEDVMLDLLQGKVKDVPETFINTKKFKQELIEFDLLDPLLPKNVVEIISNADIVCMVLGKLLKPGAVILFIDNSEGNVSLFVEDILKETGLETILGPSHGTYKKFTKSDLKTYGFPAQSSTKISVIGWMKTNISIEYGSLSKSYSSLSVQSENEFVSNSLNVQSENEFVSNSLNVQSENEFVSNSLNVQSENEFSENEFVSNSLIVQSENEFVSNSLSVQNENEFDSNSLSVRSENEFVSNSLSVQSENEFVSNSLSVQSANECISNSLSVQSANECISNSLSAQQKNEFVNTISNRSDIGDCNNDINKISNTFCDKYTQTDVNGLFKDKLNQTLVPNEIREFLTLTEAVANLLEMVKKVRTQNNSHANCCCHYH
ncbi:uncharacterized protein CEXT_539771 [Caerostris extrusa]|uniref:Uncharacterized protein n=1 Tax=Caerostris extrusa TaxID=172846 RepID=A0AAV4QAJ7_CAEEX|nr:uncharacterized protein CEXT_539771 [Caerostris extrusa]